ncbi:MAG: hypothetical protein KIT84_15420 [Labilithrix sp.]|nr:hypothetical protein [Labilithrix sp.]MCW5812415.1 hypothetical protein [Labilithrix sp.]
MTKMPKALRVLAPALALVLPAAACADVLGLEPLIETSPDAASPADATPEPTPDADTPAEAAASDASDADAAPSPPIAADASNDG